MPFWVEIVGSTPAGPTTRPTGPITARIFKTLWNLKKEGYSEDTLKAKGHRLKFLAKHVDLNSPEDVKGYIASQSRWSNAYKQGVAYAYNSYVEANGLEWNLPHFRIEDKLPRIPTEEKINQVIVRIQSFTALLEPNYSLSSDMLIRKAHTRSILTDRRPASLFPSVVLGKRTY